MTLTLVKTEKPSTYFLHFTAYITVYSTKQDGLFLLQYLTTNILEDRTAPPPALVHTDTHTLLYCSTVDDDVGTRHTASQRLAWAWAWL